MVFDSIKLSTNIDFVGQRRTELLFQIIVSVFGVIGFVWGYYVQDFGQTLLVLAAGIVLSSLIVLPPWPFWKRNPLKWQKPQPSKTDSASEPTSSPKSSKQKPNSKKADTKKQ